MFGNPALVAVAHGSRDPRSAATVAALVDEVRRQRPELDATLCWLAEKPLRPGARLLLKHGTRITPVIVGAVGERLSLDADVPTWEPAPEQLGINDIAHAALRTADPLPVDEYADIRATGSFLLIDPPTGNTLAAGLVGTPLAVAR